MFLHSFVTDLGGNEQLYVRKFALLCLLFPGLTMSYVYNSLDISQSNHDDITYTVNLTSFLNPTKLASPHSIEQYLTSILTSCLTSCLMFNTGSSSCFQCVYCCDKIYVRYISQAIVLDCCQLWISLKFHNIQEYLYAHLSVQKSCP